ncbi:MAG: hypothetical protein ACOYIF_09145 [Acetivibrionales bacterium]|jgi:hypothetical protein
MKKERCAFLMFLHILQIEKQIEKKFVKGMIPDATKIIHEKKENTMVEILCR